MNRILLSILFLIGVPGSIALPVGIKQNAEEQIWSTWNTAKEATYTDVGVDAPRVAEAGFALKKMLLSQDNTLPGDPKERIAVELVDFTTALAWAHVGNFELARDSFASEVAYQASLGRPFLENTREPYCFAKEVFSLHSSIIANCPNALPIPNLGYDYFPIEGDNKQKNFIFVYGSDGEFQDEFVTKDVAKDEQKKMIYLMTPDKQGHYTVTDQAEVIANRVQFAVSARRINQQVTLELDGVSKVIEFLSNSKFPSVHVSPRSRIALRIYASKIQQPLAALTDGAHEPKQEHEAPSPVPSGASKSPPSSRNLNSADQSINADRPLISEGTNVWLGIACAIFLALGVAILLKWRQRTHSATTK